MTIVSMLYPISYLIRYNHFCVHSVTDLSMHLGPFLFLPYLNMIPGTNQKGIDEASRIYPKW